jgi:hypothetical protein
MTPINTNSFNLHQTNRASHAPVGLTRGFEYEDEDGDHEAEASLQIEGQAPATASGARSASLMLLLKHLVVMFRIAGACSACSAGPTRWRSEH